MMLETTCIGSYHKCVTKPTQIHLKYSIIWYSLIKKKYEHRVHFRGTVYI